MSFGNTSKDFKVTKAGFAGDLKPSRVKARKVTEHVSGHMPVNSGSFGNTTT